MIKEDFQNEKNILPPDHHTSSQSDITDKIPNYYEFRRNTIIEIHGYFSKRELDTIIPFVKNNITDMYPEADKCFFIKNFNIHYKQNESLPLTREAFNILVNKIDRLNIAQLYFLQEEILHMWTRQDPFRYIYSLFLY
jgi:hypothetical protein